MTNKCYVTLSSLKYNYKPTGSQAGAVSNSLSDSLVITPEGILKEVTNGKSFAPAVYEGNRCNDNWESQQVFVVDVDDGTPVDTVINRFEDKGITPNCYYYSYSSTEDHPRYHLLFFLDHDIIEPSEAEDIQQLLMNISGCADEGSKDLSHFFYGTNKDGSYLTPKPVSTGKILQLLDIQRVTDNYDRASKITESVGSYSSTIGNHTSCKDSKIDVDWYKKRRKIKRDCTFEINKAISNTKILSDFDSGEWLHHPQLFGIATNLWWVKGGIKYMKQRMKEFNKAHKGETTIVNGKKVEVQYTKNNFNIFKYLNKKNKTYEGNYYKPMRLESFSPYNESAHNIITSTKKPKGYVEVKNREEISLEDAEDLFQQKFNKFLEDDSDSIYLFKCPTALGKTQALVDLEGITIAAPTNDLKSDISNRLNVNNSVTPEIEEDEFENDEINKKIKKFHQAGLSGAKTKLLKKVRDHGNYNDDRDTAREYLDQLQRAYSTNDTVVTTHVRGIHSDFINHDTIVFDEDPYSSIVEINNVKMKDLWQALSLDLPDDQITLMKKYLDKVSDLEVGEYFEPTPINIDVDAIIDQLEKNLFGVDIIEFFKARWIYQNKDGISYSIKNTIPEKKTAILSASANEYIYKKLYGDRLKVVTLPPVERKGDIIQHTDRSYSRTSLEEGGTEIINDYLQEYLPDTPVITFKTEKNNIVGAVEDLHYGKSEGSNELEGRDIAVVGTDHKNNALYILLALTIGIDFTTADLKKENFPYGWINYDDRKFRFKCYSHSGLRKLQLSIIESELIQAVGRARTLREDCTAHLFSNFPLKQTTKYIY